MSEAGFSPETTTVTYGAFIEDLKSQNLEVKPDTEIRELVRQSRDNSLPEEERQKARNEVINANLRAIPYVIKNLPSKGIAPEELVGQGFEVLNSCINNFGLDNISPKTEEESKFSSYLFTSLRRNLSSAKTVESVNDKVPLPENVANYANVMRKVRERFLQEEHREPNANEWYKATVDFLGENRSLSSLREFTPGVFDAAKTHKIEKRYVPIGKNVGKSNIDRDTLTTSLGNIEDTLSDPDLDVEDEAMKKALEADMEKAMSSLTNRERLVLQLRHGIGLNEDGKPIHPMTFEQIAPLFGVTRERIRQIEDRAMRKMRHPSRVKYVKDYIEEKPDLNKEYLEQARYKNLLANVATHLINTKNRDGIIGALRELRRGSAETGKFDIDTLKRFFGIYEINDLLEKERGLSSSPRQLTKDLCNVLNNYISGLKDESIVFKTQSGYPNNNLLYYWQKAPEITIDDLQDSNDADMSEDNKATPSKLKEKEVDKVAINRVKDEKAPERNEIYQKYENAVNNLAVSIIGRITPDEFKDMFSRGMYVSGQDGKKLHPRVFEGFYTSIDTIGKLVENKNVNVLDIGADVAEAINKHLNETPREKRNWMWRDVDEVTFTQEDYENWIKETNKKWMEGKQKDKA